MSERNARRLVLGLVLLAPLVYLPRILLGSQTELPGRPAPAWTHLVVVTVGTWPDLPHSLEQPALADFDRRASRVSAVFAPSASRAATAASLWTGRYPRSHGVLSNDLALAEGTWTLAAAAREAGTRTAAFLQEPFVGATGIGGFDTVVENGSATAEELAFEAVEFVSGVVDERVLVWVHLANAGEGGRDLAQVIEGVTAGLTAADRGPESTVVLAVLARGATDGPSDTIDPLGAPLWVALPGALQVGRRSEARLSLVDLPGTLRLVLGLPAPTQEASRADVMWNALRGGGARPGVVVQGERDVWRRGDRRVILNTDSGSARAEARIDGLWRALEGSEAATLLAEARVVAKSITTGRTPARTAITPPGEWPGW